MYFFGANLLLPGINVPAAETAGIKETKRYWVYLPNAGCKPTFEGDQATFLILFSLEELPPLTQRCTADYPGTWQYEGYRCADHIP